MILLLLALFATGFVIFLLLAGGLEWVLDKLFDYD